MSFSVARRLRPAHVYRVGLYGGTGSGKTCILTALGMGAGRAHPAGYSCVRQSQLPSGRQPAGDPLTWTPEELRKDPAKAFHRGNLWVREAESRMRSGRGLEGNDTGDPPLLLVYDLAVPGRGRMTVEVTDFAGELLNPHIPAEENAKALRRVLLDVDALLVLAEVPYPGQDVELLSEALKTLEQAFLGLARQTRGPTLPIPVGLLLNKWDRRGGPTASDATGRDEVEGFLASSAPHRALRDSLQAVAVETRSFAVSAFGRHLSERDAAGRPVPGLDRPAAFPLPSFGVEDPFVWACLASDEIKLRRLSAERPASVGLLNPARCWRAWRGGASFVRRLPPASQERQSANNTRRRGRAGVIAQAALCMFSFVFAICAAEWLAFDQPTHRRMEAVLRNASASPEESRRAEAWFDDYASSGWHRHRGLKWFALAADEATRRIAGWRDDREQRLWDAACRDGETVSQLESVTHYLAYFPSGKHADDAVRKRDDLQDRILHGPARDANRGLLRQLQERFAEAKSRRNATVLKDLRIEHSALAKDRAQWHNGDFETVQQLGVELAAEYAAADAEEERFKNYDEWKAKEKTIHTQITNAELGPAATAISACKARYGSQAKCRDEVIRLETDFPGLAEVAIKNTVDRAIESRTWRHYLDNKLEPLVKHGTYVTLVGRTGEDALAREIGRLKLAWDKQIYDDFLKEPSVDRAIVYLKTAPVQRMKTSVERLTRWNHDMHQATKLGLEITQIEWKKWYYDSAVRVRLEVKRAGRDNWEELLNFTEESKKDKVSGPFKTELEVVPKDAIEYRITLRAEGGAPYISARLEGSVSESVTPIDLLAGRTKVIHDDRTTTVTVKVTGIDPRPQPEPWK